MVSRDTKMEAPTQHQDRDVTFWSESQSKKHTFKEAGKNQLWGLGMDAEVLN